MHSICVITVISLQQHQKKLLHLGLNHLSTRHLPDHSTAQPVPPALSKLCHDNFPACLPCCNPSTCRSCKELKRNGLEKEKDILAIASHRSLQVRSCSWHPITGIASQLLQEEGLKKKLNSSDLVCHCLSPCTVRRLLQCAHPVGSSFLVSHLLTCACAQGVTMGS